MRFFYSPTTIYGLNQAGLPHIGMQFVVFRKHDYFGGRILPDWGQMKPRWVRDEPLPLIDGVLGWFDHGVETRPFDSSEASAVRCEFCCQAAVVQ